MLKFPSSVRRGGAKRRGGSKAAVHKIALRNHPSRDPLRDPAALLTQEGYSLSYFNMIHFSLAHEEEVD